MRRAAILSLCLVALAPTGARASIQAIVRIADAPTCAHCAISLAHLHTIGDRSGPGRLFGQPAALARDSKGKFYVVEYRGNALVKHYDARGEFIGTIGTDGPGSSAFGGISALLIGEGDSLFVFDYGSRRVRVFSPTGLPARSFPFEGRVTGAVQLQNGNLLISGQHLSPEYLGYPLHTLDASGALVAAHGSDDPMYRPDAPEAHLRALAPAPDGAVWSAYRTLHTIEKWSAQGNRLITLAVQADWFRPYLRRIRPSRDTPVAPWLMTLREDGGQRLILAISVAAVGWAGRWRRYESDPLQDDMDPNPALFESVVEVVDLTTNKLLLSHRVPELIVGFLDSTTIYTYSLLDQNIPQIGIYRLRVQSE